MKKLGAAVIGCGIFGGVHARIYAADPRVELVSVWSRRRERAEAAAAKYGVEAAPSWEQIASDDRVQLVSVATPDFAHTEPVLAALAGGKHVLVEKPMATTSDECRQMIEAARRTGVRLMVNFHQRWHPPFARAREAIVTGEIGKPSSAYIRLSDRIEVATEWLSWAGQSGPEWFLLPHILDLARWLVGREPRWVFAAATHGVLASKGIDCYDTVQVQVDFSGTICSFESSWILPPSYPGLIDFQVQVQGTEGRVDVSAGQEQVSVSAKEYRTPLVLDFITEEGPIRHFVDCVATGSEPMCGGEDGLVVTRMAEAVVQSIREGSRIDLG